MRRLIRKLSQFSPVHALGTSGAKVSRSRAFSPNFRRDESREKKKFRDSFGVKKNFVPGENFVCVKLTVEEFKKKFFDAEIGVKFRLLNAECEIFDKIFFSIFERNFDFRVNFVENFVVGSAGDSRNLKKKNFSKNVSSSGFFLKNLKCAQFWLPSLRRYRRIEFASVSTMM